MVRFLSWIGQYKAVGHVSVTSIFVGNSIMSFYFNSVSYVSLSLFNLSYFAALITLFPLPLLKLLSYLMITISIACYSDVFVT